MSDSNPLRQFGGLGVGANAGVGTDAGAATTRRQCLRLSLGAGAWLAGAGSAGAGGAHGTLGPLGPLGTASAMDALAARLPQLVWRERRLQALGTHLRLQAAHASGARLDAALDAAVAAIQRVERQMSLFDPNSAASRLNRDGVLLRPEAELLQMLRLAQLVSAKSDGAFDVTVQPYWAAWSTAQVAGRVATAAELAKARARVGWKNLAVSADKISFQQAGMGITLNGIAQGFAGDLAQAALRSHGIEHALLDTGEWSSWGDSPDGSPWRIGVADPRSADLRQADSRLADLRQASSPSANAGQIGPRPAGARPARSGMADLPEGLSGSRWHSVEPFIATLQPAGRAIATSSDANYRFGAGDQHHHIFNPHTGYSPRQLASVTVMAPTCVLADALTKVMFMGGLDDALRLARRWQVEVLAVDKHGRWRASAGMGKLS